MCSLEDRNYFTKSILVPLLNDNKILMTMPNKPTSPKQKYITNYNK
ncbi:Fic family protein [Tannockella kyphosi]